MFSCRFSLTPLTLGLLVTLGLSGPSGVYAQTKGAAIPQVPAQKNAKSPAADDGPVAVTPRTNEPKANAPATPQVRRRRRQRVLD